jgi:cbb3-type cytochrome oxidase subunit 3
MDLHMLPVVGMLLFLAIFAAVLLRVVRRDREGTYQRMAAMPLRDDKEGGISR